MKIFQVFNGICHYDATPVHPTLADTVGKYAPDILFVEAPDYVFEGWGYDETKEGDTRFIQPTCIDEGWVYNVATGSFVPTKEWQEENPYPQHPQEDPTQEEKISELQDKVRVLEAENSALKESTAFYEECLVEMAEIVYA